METPPKPSPNTLVLSMPHPSWGLGGLGVVPLASAWPCAVDGVGPGGDAPASSRSIRFFVMTQPATPRRSAQMLRYPHNGWSAVSSRIPWSRRAWRGLPGESGLVVFQPPVAFFSLQGELSHQGFQTGTSPSPGELCPVMLMTAKGSGRIS